MKDACNTGARRHLTVKRWDGLGKAEHIVRSKHYTYRDTHRHNSTRDSLPAKQIMSGDGTLHDAAQNHTPVS